MDFRCTLIAEIREDTGIVGSFHRVVWCPYIPDEEDDDPDEDVDRLLLTTHANTGKIFQILRCSLMEMSLDVFEVIQI